MAENKYTCNDRFFENIDTEEKAYWLGFVTADGWLTDRGMLGIKLHKKDRSHLVKFREAIESNHRIYDYDDGSVSLCVQRQAINSSLRKLGITPRKSLTATPATVSSDLYKHYWRGLVDGDGTLIHDPRPKFILDLAGTFNIVSEFARFCYQFCDTAAIPRQYGNLWRFRLQSKAGFSAVADEIYKDSTVYLNRKYHKYVSMKNALEEGVNHG